jgi:hypothetical protein
MAAPFVGPFPGPPNLPGPWARSFATAPSGSSAPTPSSRTSSLSPGPERSTRPGIRGLFQQRVAGDAALLQLTRLRFDQAGMPAEVYADSPEELEYLLGLVPEHPTLPAVHLNRRLNLLEPADLATVAEFVARFDGRVSGFVVHDRPRMIGREAVLVEGLRELGGRESGPMVFLEYAAGTPLDWFTGVAHLLADLPRVSICVDTGHVGLAEVRRQLAAGPGGRAATFSLTDPALPQHVDRVQAATRAGLPAVLALIAELAPLGKTLHLHLHDGHPAVTGLSDHFSFLTRFPIAFDYHGARSLEPMFGPAGLAAVLRQAVTCCTPERLSITLEIHQAEGRLPLSADAIELFRHWIDLTNAERLNYWLSVIAENHVLADSYLEAALRPEGGVPDHH